MMLCLNPAWQALAVSEPVAAPAGKLSVSRDYLNKGQFAQAAKALEIIVKDNPTNCEAQLLLGQAYGKLKNYLKAREHLRLAVRLGRGSANGQKANLALMALPAAVVKPKTGAQTKLIASLLGLGRERGLAGAGHATVIDFYASWCKPCKQLDEALNRIKPGYAEKVNFMRVDVDDPQSQTLVDQYEVSPIPTVVYLNDDGEVVSYSIGFSGDNSITGGIAKALASQAK
jgi:thioredoxin-like negative regulator of GroEL